MMIKINIPRQMIVFAQIKKKSSRLSLKKEKIIESIIKKILGPCQTRKNSGTLCDKAAVGGENTYECLW